MSINKFYAVFGLGKYGLAVAKELIENGAEVLAVDINENIVNSAIDFIPVCKCADITDPDVIQELGISNADVVIVAMADNLEASVMAITLCKEAGVPTIIAKCASEMHRKIMLKVGADKVVFPENESGIRLAKNLLSSGFVDIVELSKDVSMVEIDIKPEWVGKSLIDLNLRKKYALNVVAIKNGDSVSIDVDPTLPLKKGTELIVVVNSDKLSKLK
ncbi:MAG: TrkA family potassium uptake protein [Ruminococcus sp.]|nr:TrkA family potassium uptake protein [Ruminococcus sp.]